MKKLLLCLTAVISFSLLNVATADSLSDYCESLIKNQKLIEAITVCVEACNLNEAKGCGLAGVLYAAGAEYSENSLQERQYFQKAKEYYGKSCVLGDTRGCADYRRLNERGY
jgi:hypothetical protein